MGLQCVGTICKFGSGRFTDHTKIADSMAIVGFRMGTILRYLSVRNICSCQKGFKQKKRVESLSVVVFRTDGSWLRGYFEKLKRIPEKASFQI